VIHFSNRQYRQSWFGRFAKSTAYYSGHPIVFGLAALTIVLWAMSGPLFGFSDTWQLVINTSTTIVTFLMVFLIQNTQNRDSQAVQIKLDELIRAIKGAHLSLLNLEELPGRGTRSSAAAVLRPRRACAGRSGSRQVRHRQPGSRGAGR
jgi:low affinity Fe/Cu permease